MENIHGDGHAANNIDNETFFGTSGAKSHSRCIFNGKYNTKRKDDNDHNINFNKYIWSTDVKAILLRCQMMLSTLSRFLKITQGEDESGFQQATMRG